MDRSLIHRTLFVLCVIWSGLCLLPVAAKDQPDSKVVSKDEEISAEKREAIEELLEVTETTKRLPLLIDALKSSARKNFALAIEPGVKADSKNKDKSEEEIKQIVAEKSSIMTEKYLQMFYERVDLDKLVKDVALEVYAKNFTTEEIKNITAFYKTPTGAKARKVMPKVARESMQLTQKLIRPELKEIVKAVMEEK